MDEIAKLKEDIEFLKGEFNKLRSNSTIPYEVGGAFRARLADLLPTNLELAPLTAITAPTGGATVDAAARTAINSIITALEDLGLINPN